MTRYATLALLLTACGGTHDSATDGAPSSSIDAAPSDGSAPAIDAAPSDGGASNEDLTSKLPDASSNGVGVPSKVQIILQGVDYPGQSQTVAPPSGTANHITIGWKSVAGATAYNIYRSSNQGAYALYASNVTASAASATYDAYAKPSTPWTCANVWESDGNGHTIDCPVQTTVDSAYQDTNATNAVGSTPVSTTGTKGGTGNDWYSGTGYTYKVSAIVDGVEGAQSNDSYIIYFADGVRVANEGEFQDIDWTWSDTSLATASPLGFTTNAKFAATPSAGLVNPYTGIGAVNQNLNLRGMNYFVLSVYVADGGATSWNLIPERSGDISINTINTSKYGTAVAGHWNTFNVPIDDLMVDSAEGTYVIQHSLYKINFGSTQPSTTTVWMEWYFSKCGDSTDGTCKPMPLHTY